MTVTPSSLMWTGGFIVVGAIVLAMIVGKNSQIKQRTIGWLLWPTVLFGILLMVCGHWPEAYDQVIGRFQQGTSKNSVATVDSTNATASVVSTNTQAASTNHLALPAGTGSTGLITGHQGSVNSVVVSGTNLTFHEKVGIDIHNYPQYVRVEKRNGTNVTEISEYGNPLPGIHHGVPPMQPDLMQQCILGTGKIGVPAPAAPQTPTVTRPAPAPKPKQAAKPKVPSQQKAPPVVTQQAPPLAPPILPAVVQPPNTGIAVLAGGTFVATQETTNKLNKWDYLAPFRFVVPKDWRAEYREIIIWVEFKTERDLTHDQVEKFTRAQDQWIDSFVRKYKGKFTSYYALNNPYDQHRQKEFGKWMREFAAEESLWHGYLKQHGLSIDKVYFTFAPNNRGTG